MTIGQKIEKLRNSKGLSQRRLAKNSGLTPPAINQYESGKRTPDLKSYVSICKTLEISLDDFMENVDI